MYRQWWQHNDDVSPSCFFFFLLSQKRQLWFVITFFQASECIQLVNLLFILSNMIMFRTRKPFKTSLDIDATRLHRDHWESVSSPFLLRLWAQHNTHQFRFPTERIKDRNMENWLQFSIFWGGGSGSYFFLFSFSSCLSFHIVGWRQQLPANSSFPCCQPWAWVITNGPLHARKAVASPHGKCSLFTHKETTANSDFPLFTWLLGYLM